jgi:lipoate---protein ligase
MYLLQIDGVSIFHQLELEEALLRLGTGDFCILNSNATPAIVLGLSNDVEELVDLPLAKALHLPIYRRFSGGGAVCVEENSIFVTLIFDNHSLPCEKSPEALIAHGASVFTNAFSPYELQVQDQDYVLCGKKIGGNAQSFTKQRTLQHTSLLYSWREDLMCVLKMPKRQPAYRQLRSHTDFCGRIETHFPGKEMFRKRLCEAIQENYACKNIFYDDIKELLRKPHRKSLKALVIN